MFKVVEFYVRAVAVVETSEGLRREPIGDARRTRDEGQAQAWAQEMRDRLDRRSEGGPRHEVLVYSVVGEPMFDLWAEPQVKGRYGRGER